KLTTDNQDLNRLLTENSTTSGFDQMEGGTGGIERWVEHGVWLIPVIVLLAAVSFRRGWLLGFAVLCITPPPAHAFGWQDLWLRTDQQAQTSLQQGDPQTAAQQFRDLDWRGTALYEAGDYATAAQVFAESDNIEARYNQGNALARAGNLHQAIEAYQDVLQQNPAHDDAKANLELLEKLLQDQQQQQGDDSSQQQEEGEENKEGGEDGTNSENNSEQQQDTAQPENENDDSANDTDEQNTDDTQTDSHQNDAIQPEQDDQRHNAQQDDRQESFTPEDTLNESDQLPSEEDIALDQWLRQIPEDPSGLLRRKFMLEHMQRKQR
ncbi:MAG TPA: hypothetical protein DEF07_09690, partial [Nitrosomonas sp.]|nr:hypothetical protein [Nitrosomonas sp.]